MAQPSWPNTAWYWFSPAKAKQWSPPLRAQWCAAERKYQQRGRCSRLPPSVATWRICGLAELPAASASAV